jgi:signal transduction histidine kinase
MMAVPRFVKGLPMTSHSIATGSLLGGTDHAHAFLAHEVRNLVNVAILSFDVLRATGAGVAGDKGQVLRRSLNDLRTLINRSLSEVRTAHGGSAAIDIGEFINEIEAAAIVEAHAKGIRFVVRPVIDGLVVEADRYELGAAVRNLVQNAIKFTRPGTTVDLCVKPGADRVRIEVHDECGGLPGGRVDDLFRPFEQRGRDRSGLGLGLAFSRKVVEASGGVLSVRNLRGHGCVFAIELPLARSGDLCIAEQR